MTDPAPLKTCIKCDAPKPRHEFNRHHFSTDGLRGFCKACQSQAALSRKVRKKTRPALCAETVARMASDVEWYRRHGKHPQRIKRDSEGHEYVIGDHSWNGDDPSRAPEIIEQRCGGEGAM